MLTYLHISVFFYLPLQGMLLKMAVNRSVSYAYTEMLDDSRSVIIRDLSLPTTCFYQLLLFLKAAKPVTPAGQGPSLSGHLALKLPGPSVLLMLTRHPCIDPSIDPIQLGLCVCP